MSVLLAVGDQLYLYSDGLPDAMSPMGERFSDARLLDTITTAAKRPLDESISILIAEITRWQGNESPLDDISVLAMEIAAPSASSVAEF